MRRPLAGLLFAIAFGCLCLALGGWLLQRSVLSPDASRDAAADVMLDPTLRAEFAQVVTDGTAAGMYPADPNAPIRVLATVEQVLTIPAGAALTADVLADAHARLVGETEAPVAITPGQLVQIVRDEHAAVLPALVLDVPRLGALATTASILDVLVPIGAIAALVFFVLCLITRPDGDVLARSVGIGLLVVAAVVFLFDYVVPAFVTPLLDDSVWARIPAAAAKAGLVGTTIVSLVIAAVGGLLLMLSTRMGRRTRWSTPVSTYRYREERRWS